MRRALAVAALALVSGACDYSTGLVQAPGSTEPAKSVAKPPGPGPGGQDRPRFQAKIEPISPELRARMTSWRPGCPVGLRDLRLLTLSHWGFDGEPHFGRLIVARGQAKNVVKAMHRLFDLKFAIRRMRLIDAYGSDDHRSMAANNTSAFNCRFVFGTTRWSEHAYGRAIDINPIQNPAVEGSRVSPPAGRPYANRSRRAKGMIHAGDAVVRAFAAVGWEWAGYWRGFTDYQHFSATGR
ncbi:MAG: hypothetical protein QOF68_2457 [Gaiellales bacterium]|jgi:poly-gamma-glutamate synthesis protein (capsule biosynthesis protein)|nr:hypothetical protein [Gaiellales bacterium]